MNYYVISYDIASGNDGNPLRLELARLGGFRVLLSQWLIATSSTAPQLRDHLLRYIADGDRLLVNGFGNDGWASHNLLNQDKLPNARRG